jgi:hypothetical protein
MVYFRAARGAYCRNLRLRCGEPFGLIRLEAQHRVEDGEVMDFFPFFPYPESSRFR